MKAMTESLLTRRVARSPVPTLPDDILSLIFLSCRDGESERIRCPHISSTNGPLKLTWINRQWRELALSLPELWTGISLVPSQAGLKLLNLFVSRSGPQLPLRFDLRYGGDSPSSSISSTTSHDQDMRRINDVIGRLRQRWEAICIHALNLEALGNLFEWFNSGAPKLKFFQIQTQSTAFRGERHRLNFLLCPELEFVKIGCPRVCIASGFSSSLSLQYMTILDLSYTHSHLDGLAWLQCCPNLVNSSLCFYSASSDLDGLADASPIILTRLSRLSVSTYFVDGTGDPSMFLALLTLPALRELSLSMNNLVFANRSEGWRAVAELLQRGYVTSLRSLEVQGTPMRAPQLLEILRMQSWLKELSIDGTLATTAVFDALGAKVSLTRSAPLCPMLETLRLRAHHGAADALANMVEERCSLSHDHAMNPASFRTLKTLVLMWCAGQSIVDHPKIKSALRSGLEVVQTPSLHPFQCSFSIT